MPTSLNMKTTKYKNLLSIVFFCLVVGLTLNYQNCAGTGQNLALGIGSPSAASNKVLSFKAPTGNAIQIYDGVIGYAGRPIDILKNNGFGDVYFSPAGPPYISGWFDGYNPPTYLIGATEKAELRTAINAMCRSILNANSPALIGVLEFGCPRIFEICQKFR